MGDKAAVLSSKVSFVIQAQNEEKTIGKVISQIKKLKPHEIIVVVNGSTDQTSKIVQSSKCTLLEYENPLGINLGKAIGAFHASGDILVFLDADIVIPSDRLLSFVQAIQGGSDVALNDLNWAMKRKVRPHPTSLSKKALNLFLGREELGINALGAIPNAFSRKAVEQIGWWNLVDPPLAQTMGILDDLSFSAPISVDVIRTNKIRPEQHRTKAANSPYPKSTSRVIGDHLQAIKYLTEQKGIRGGYADDRKRPSETASCKDMRIKRSAVISLEQGSKQLKNTIKVLRNINVKEIVVVGSMDSQLLSDLKEARIIAVPMQESLGSYASRMLGTLNSSGKVTLFVDGHSALTEKDLLPFYEAVEKGTDIALNNTSFLLDTIHPIDPQSTIQYFLNIAIKKPGLLNSSLVTTPYAIHRQVIKKIDVQSWMIPPLAYVEVVLHGFKISAPRTVKVSSLPLNRSNCRNIFLGDHIEAIHHYLQKTNERGGFTDGGKNRALLEEMKKGSSLNEKGEI
ncbi:glycosyltransferase involved in cell wall biosynthesis [Bacillus fengqiuensis]|nr:glycosyltransferase involved in cell wall biosynthesis [Bacillus fengqiuensis]